VRGLGWIAAEGGTEHLETLRRRASDPRWRVREAVAMALQRIGVADIDRLLETAAAWVAGGWLEQRAAAAGLCEPVLLRDERHARKVLALLDAITRNMTKARDRTSDAFRALRTGMGYCWSVATAAAPEAGKKLMERWMTCDDADVAWVMRENLRKNRLARMDPAWVDGWVRRLGAPRGGRARPATPPRRAARG